MHSSNHDHHQPEQAVSAREAGFGWTETLGLPIPVSTEPALDTCWPKAWFLNLKATDIFGPDNSLLGRPVLRLAGWLAESLASTH